MPKVLVIGGGGREHAIIRALGRSAQPLELIAAPGNPGIAAEAQCYAISADDIPGLTNLATSQGVDLVVVGPEVPLVAGLADQLKEVGIPCFGPSAAAAELEGSKAFAKEIMIAAGVPTAKYQTVTTVEEGLAAIESYPVVIKADGLAAGKGVVIAEDRDQAEATLSEFLVAKKFGTEQVVIEEFLVGEELSLLALCDGERAYPLAPAQDYKRIYDGDLGPNTGGMGAYSPVPGIDQSEIDRICELVHQPVIDELAQRGMPLHGVLYAGLMLTSDGVKVLEFNVRFGDPETQAVLPRLESDFLDLVTRATEPGGLAGCQMEWSDSVAVTLVLASAGYPVTSSSGDVITGADSLPEEIELTHAGTSLQDGQLVTAGGRVLNVTALADDLAQARENAYRTAETVDFVGKQMRTDIALNALEKTR